MADLNKLSPTALKAAIAGGTEGSGQRASVIENVVYVEPCKGNMRRRKCHCGCGNRCTYGMYAKGIIMKAGCEFSMRRAARPTPTQGEDG